MAAVRSSGGVYTAIRATTHSHANTRIVSGNTMLSGALCTLRSLVSSTALHNAGTESPVAIRPNGRPARGSLHIRAFQCLDRTVYKGNSMTASPDITPIGILLDQVLMCNSQMNWSLPRAAYVSRHFCSLTHSITQVHPESPHTRCAARPTAEAKRAHIFVSVHPHLSTCTRIQLPQGACPHAWLQVNAKSSYHISIPLLRPNRTGLGQIQSAHVTPEPHKPHQPVPGITAASTPTIHDQCVPSFC